MFNHNLYTSSLAVFIATSLLQLGNRSASEHRDAARFRHDRSRCRLPRHIHAKKLTDQGLSAKVFDAASDVGGARLWNRYPGAISELVESPPFIAIF
jgi:hypothetical protein